MDIELIRGTARKVVSANVSGGAATVDWGIAGIYDLDLTTGHVMARIPALDGIYSVDLQTGRVQQTRYSLSAADMLRLDELRVGDRLRVEHDMGTWGTVEVTDYLRSEGRLQIFASKAAWVKHSGYAASYSTGWHVSPETLAAVRTEAKLPRLTVESGAA